MVADSNSFGRSEPIDIKMKSDETDADMDVPKITVFKSPPWHKPITPTITPRLSDVYEEFPSKTKTFTRRINVGGSRSLECIPENMVLQDTHKYSTMHLRDSCRLSPHQVLPPIQRFADDEMPEMRQRAYSDPHKYSAVMKKKNDERRESPLVKSTPMVIPSPPKDKPLDSSIKTKTISTSGHKVLRRTNSKEMDERASLNSPNGVLPGMPLSSDRVKHGSPLVAKPPPSDIKMSHTTPKQKLTDNTKSLSNPGTPGTPEKRMTRNRQLVNRNVSNETIITHPTVAALKEPVRNRTNSLPGKSYNQGKERRSSNSLPLHIPKEVKSSVAYALIGSPGRNRWPSPERQATSYINSDSDSPSADNTDSDSLETIHKLHPIPASQEFNSIMCDFKLHERTEQLHAITDPKEYFQKVANWKLN